MNLTRVLMPMAKPGIARGTRLSFVYHWRDFQHPLINLSDFQTYTVALGLRMYQATGGSWINLVIAASLIALVPVALGFILLQKHIGKAPFR